MSVALCGEFLLSQVVFRGDIHMQEFSGGLELRKEPSCIPSGVKHTGRRSAMQGHKVKEASRN